MQSEPSTRTEALTLFKAHQDNISIALLDVVMPHCGGVELAKRMRECRPDMPIIFMTGYDKGRVLADGKMLKNSKVLSKPVHFEELSHSLKNLLQT